MRYTRPSCTTSPTTALGASGTSGTAAVAWPDAGLRSIGAEGAASAPAGAWEPSCGAPAGASSGTSSLSWPEEEPPSPAGSFADSPAPFAFVSGCDAPSDSAVAAGNGSAAYARAASRGVPATRASDKTRASAAAPVRERTFLCPISLSLFDPFALTSS